MQVQVKLFAALHSPEVQVGPGIPFAVEIDQEASVGDLVEKLRLPPKEVKAIFVNGRARSLDWPLKPGDEVGIFPPIGGS